MFTKLLLTLTVILIALFVLRTRSRREDKEGVDSANPSASRAAPLTNVSSFPHVFKWGAYGLAFLMLLASFIYLLQRWERDQQLVDVRVINPYTGAVQDYQAKRGEIDGSVFTTIDGRRIRIAEIERLIISERSGD